MKKRSPTHEAALELAARGWYVFPCEPPILGNDESGKKPLTRVVRNGKDDAVIDTAKIDEWWFANPTANVGVSLEPSKLVVLDVDVGLDKEGKPKPGRQSLADLEKEHGALPETLTAITGSGGLHAYYTADVAIPVAQRIGFRKGLDLIVRGYVVAPPSAHFTGKPYRWNVQRSPAPVPKLFAELASKKVQATSTTNPALAPEPIKEGGRNDALFRVGCALYDNGIGEQALKAALHFENQRRFQPPLGDEEVRRVAESVMKRVVATRDVALGALVQEAAREAIADTLPPVQERSVWVRDVGFTNPPPTKFYSTGFADLDALMGGGFCTRQVCGVIGPPSAGKSAWLGSMLEAVAKQIPVLHVSTELPREELFIRYACSRLGRVWRDGLKGLVSREELRESTKDIAIRLMGCDDLSFEDPIAMIAGEAVKIANTLGVMPVIAIDYMQLLARTSEDRMRQKVGELTMHTRRMSQALDTAVISVFSTSREFYSAGKLEQLREVNDPTVYLTAAKESGDIEFDCATILFLDVDKTHEGQPKPARGAVARCRVGDIGFTGMRAQLDVGRFYSDPAAATEMMEEKKNEAKSLARADRDQLLVLDVINRLPGRTWREMKAAIHGMSNDKKDAARAELIRTGRVELHTEKSFDTKMRPITRETVRAIFPASPGNIIPGLSVQQSEDNHEAKQ